MKLIKSENAEAELVGHVIILGITILGITMIALYGVPSIIGLQDLANLRNAEQTFAVLDSHASRTVLGNSPTQITEMDLGGGTLTVVPNSTSPSYIVINSTNFSFTIPMGKVEYQFGDRLVAFEGGGVWSKYPSGTVMLSRPEFNYNGWTLTLPVFNISGSASLSGKGTAIVSVKKNPPLVVYPNTSRPDWANRTNPVNYTVVRKVYVNITSDFYDAWADYIGSVSSVNLVSEDPKNHTVGMVLTVYPPYIGKVNSISNPIVFRGLDGSNSTPVNNFSFNITSASNNLNWDIRAVNGNRYLIFYLSPDSGNWQPGKQVTLQVGYMESNSSYTETWEGSKLYTIQPNNYIYVDLLNTSLNLNYTDNIDVGADNGNSCQPFGGKIKGTRDPAFSWNNLTIHPQTLPNASQPLFNITQHYIQKMAQNGDIFFGQCSSGGNTIGSASTMYVSYYAPGGLTFLDVTDNKVDVSIS